MLLALASFIASTAATSGVGTRERFVPGYRADQLVRGWLGHRLVLHAAELARQLQRASTDGSGQLGVLVEAAALLCQAMNCGPAGEELSEAAQALVRKSSEWKEAGAFRRGLWGLLRYYEASGDRRALDAARRAGDAASTTASSWRDGETGMGPLAGPAALLFAYTGERRRLTHGISPEMAEQGAPRLLRALWAQGRLEGIERARAEEVLSTLAGLVGLYRLTGQGVFLLGAQKGWKEIVDRHLYVTGAVGTRGRLRGDGTLPGEVTASVGEPGVTAEWLRLNVELLRVTGEVKYADEIERTLYNHLLALQDGRTGAWALSAPLIGKRRYEAQGSDRGAGAALGLSLASASFRGSLDGHPALVFYVPGEVTLPVAAGGAERRAKFVLETDYPDSGDVVLRVGEGGGGRYAVHLRVPGWCTRYTARAGKTTWSGRAGEWLVLEREWSAGEEVRIEMEMAVGRLDGGRSYPDQVAFRRGPQVLALEAGLNPGVRHLHRAAVEANADLRLAGMSGRTGEVRGKQTYAIMGTALSWTGRGALTARTKLVLVPFADAHEYRVWLPMANRLSVGPVAVTAFGEEAWSADGAVDGSICDERTDTFRTASSDGREGSWFAVELDKPEWIERVVYRHGQVMTDGGWFDTSKGKPQVQVKRSRDGPWETVGRLESYPVTNGKAPPALVEGQAFDLKLPAPIQVVAVRVVGQPGGRFSSCAELAAYGPAREPGATWRSAATPGGAMRLAQNNSR